jgi:O-antigen/teichoic acid export membrane protein
LIPLSTFLVGGFNTLTYWNTRKGDFTSISKARVLLSLSNEALSIPLGLSVWKNGGLVISRIVSQAVALTYFGKVFRSNKNKMLGAFRKKGLFGTVKKYRDFPIQSGTAGILNNISAEVPFFFISSFYGLQVLGWFALSSRIISVPVQLIGSAFSDVFYKKAMETSSGGELGRLMKKTVGLLLLPTVLLFFLVLAFGKWLMGPVFGARWAPAGAITCALAFLLAARLIYTSLNAVIFVQRRNDYDVKWNAANLIIMTGSLWLGYGLHRDYLLSILFYSISSALVYIFNTIWMFRIVKKSELSGKPEDKIHLPVMP